MIPILRLRNSKQASRQKYKKKAKASEHSKIFYATASADLPTYDYCIFITYCTVFYQKKKIHCYQFCLRFPGMIILSPRYLLHSPYLVLRSERSEQADQHKQDLRRI